jgi:serine/threonine-protein kinase RsbW
VQDLGDGGIVNAIFVVRNLRMHWYDRKGIPHDPVFDLGLAEHVQKCQLYRPAELASVLEKITAWMKLQGFPARDIFAVVLTTQEAASNAFRHGNRGDCTKPVRLWYLVTEHEVLIRVEDEGPGFDPEQTPDSCHADNFDRPGGRGLTLMRAYSHSISFAPPGNRVTFSRRRSKP